MQILRLVVAAARFLVDSHHMTRISVPVFLLVAALFAGSAAARADLAGAPPRAVIAAARSAPDARNADQIFAVGDLEQQLLAAINEVRSEHGLTALRSNPGLAAAARAHSLSMAERGFFRHSSYDGADFWRRLQAVYAPQSGRWWGVGENILWWSPGLSSGQALEMWLRSPPHRKNLLAPTWREIGIGGVHALAAPGVYDGSAVTILTADFGAR
jgi:uncharacterized protein YkwD